MLASAVHKAAAQVLVTASSPQEVGAGQRTYQQPLPCSVPEKEGGEASAGEDTQRPCCVCLGVLQAQELPLAAVSAAQLRGLPEAQGNAGSWESCQRGSVQGLAALIRCEPAALKSCCLQAACALLLVGPPSWSLTPTEQKLGSWLLCLVQAPRPCS